MNVPVRSPFRTIALTCVALIAFAANSLLCRHALARPDIDPASFTTIRLASGALLLWVLVALRTGPALRRPSGSWRASAMLFLYAICFSFAYIGLHAGVGALILFGAVQFTMIAAGLHRGERMNVRQWFGLTAALTGLVVLLLPGASAPSPGSALLMALAGIAWGVYSLLGRGAGDAVAATAGNFLRSVPLALAASLLALPAATLSTPGIVLALLSGTLASALGYVIWYRVLPDLRATSAAAAQLAVPVITAAAGVILLAEPITARLLICIPVVLGGVALATLRRRPQVPRR